MTEIFDKINSWKNKEVFQKQLELNMQQISDTFNYPLHWKYFLEIISKNNINTFLDIGCGAGIYYELLKNNFPDITYFGMDYSEEAISIAKSHWQYEEFYQMDLWELNTDIISQFDAVHMGALLDVLPNANDALDYILSLSPKLLIISRIDFSENNIDEFYTYTAYDTIETYKFKHSKTNIDKIINKYSYTYTMIENVMEVKK